MATSRLLPSETPEPTRQQTNRQERFRCLWFLVGRFVLLILRARKGWSALGQRLQGYTSLVQHLERRRGVLLHKVTPAAKPKSCTR